MSAEPLSKNADTVETPTTMPRPVSVSGMLATVAPLAAMGLAYSPAWSAPLWRIKNRGNKYAEKGLPAPKPTTPAAHVRGKDRNAPCPCGSGIKSKKCLCVDAIVKFDHPALSSVAELCTADDLKDKRLQQLVAILKRTSEGVGIAANQIGWLKQVIVLWPERTGEPEVLINPEIAWRSSEESTKIECCLSYPGVEAPVKRAFKIKLKAMDMNWQPVEQFYYGYASRVAQHEYDHIFGICRVGDAWKLQNGIPANAS